MQSKRVYDINIAINRLQNYCALQDRCQWDVIEKMKEWGLQETTQNHILELLINEKYVDEERFAISFCRGKFRIKKWGKQKISTALKRKQISKTCINKGLAKINEQEYLNTFEELYTKKKNSLKETNLFIRKKKISNFLIQRGFEANLVWEKMQELKDK